MIQLLSREKMTYLELLISTGLEPDRHHGWFDYHLRVLLDERIITRKDDQYLLTDSGKGIARLLSTIERESHRLFKTEVKPMKEEAEVGQEAPSITIEEIPDGKLTISLDHRKPLWQQGEQRTYMDTASIPEEMGREYGRNNYYIETCLERLYFPEKEEYHYTRLFDAYQSKYDGTEENRRIVQRTEEGYFHSLWSKIWEVQKQDGLFETKRVDWCIRGPTEPEEEVSDPPKKILSLPSTLKIGDRPTEKHKLFDVKGVEFGQVISEEKIVGEYIVKNAGREYSCLLSRTRISYVIDPKKQAGRSWKRVKDRFIGKDGVVVLNRWYDTAQGLRQWLTLFKHKNWEKSPKIECEGETYYLWNEDYLVERHIPIVNLGRTEDPWKLAS